jgi:Bacterial Ig-like domain (group 3)
VDFDNAGTCVIDANQAGDGTFAAAPQVQQTFAIGVVPTTTTVATTPSSSVFGQTVTATATVTATSGTPAGSVQFAVDGTDLGAPVTVSGGTATSGDLTDSMGHPLAPGAHAVTAAFTPDDAITYSGSQDSVSHVVSQATTTTTVVVNPTTIVATVSPVAPGAGVPSGSVAFTVDGTSVGSATLSAGVATLSHVTPPGMTRHVAAVYAGDSDFTGSSASTSRQDPSITATVSSAHPKTHFGWYRSTVTVTFHCVTNGAPLTSACPTPVSFTHNGAGQSVTRTITATDGGTDTVAVGGINIDTTPPKVHVTGIHNGAVYFGAVPKAHCVAKDPLSGVASCRITRHTHGTRTTYRAVATDRAGNTSTVSGSYRTLGISLLPAPFRNGSFVVRTGHSGRTYTLVVHAKTRPTYYDAAQYPVRPHVRDRAMFAAGHDRWTLGLTMLPVLHAHRLWNLGIKIGHTLHVIRIRIHPFAH